jgi:hypothetical protein
MVVGGRRHRCINAGLRPVEIVSLTTGLEWGESGSSVFISIIHKSKVQMVVEIFERCDINER